MMTDNLEKLIQRMSSGEWDERLSAVDAIVKTHGNDAVPALIGLLKSPSADTRNAAALAFRDIGDSDAVGALFDAIKAPENRENRATLVYALETLDCREHFLDVVELAFSSKWDVRLAAMNILSEQGFLVNDDDVKKAHKLIDAALSSGSGDDHDWIEQIRVRLADF